jgi:hypothetical protein
LILLQEPRAVKEVGNGLKTRHPVTKKVMIREVLANPSQANFRLVRELIEYVFEIWDSIDEELENIATTITNAYWKL